MIKNRIESFAKYAGIATVSVEWLALILYYVIAPTHFGGSYPISYFSTLPQTKLTFNICYTLAGIFFWIFFKYHLHKYYRAPLKAMGISLILFVCLALYPYSYADQLTVIIHHAIALSGGVFFLAGMISLARNSHDRQVALMTNTAVLISTMLLVIFAVFLPNGSSYTFVLEAGAWFVWQVWVLWISYYSYKNLLHKRLQ